MNRFVCMTVSLVVAVVWGACLAAAHDAVDKCVFKEGDKLWVVDVISPFGGPEEMVANFKAGVFPDKEIHFLAVSAEGKKEVKVL